MASALQPPSGDFPSTYSGPPSVVQGSIATFGTYTVDETKKTYTLKFEGSSFPNRAETEQTRAFEIAVDELKVANPSTSMGGSSELVYRRAK
ncbi:lipocalin-like domain-containing protein [Bradyrhizobium sp. AUGA SZCCT0160]|nr:lipocalin-like domain-containing protein [Bradyrhizobium sp. AUGA SZCCT0160]